jgi:uncharacterized protein (DUF305 family)
MAAHHQHSVHTTRNTTSAKGHSGSHHAHPYRLLFIMAVLHFVAMFALMYSMVNTATDVYPNLNQMFMAGTMTAPMLLLELALMRSMYQHRQLNIVAALAGLVLLVAFFFAIRLQTGISDQQFLKSMIPHHSGAVLMCREARLNDAEVRDLCVSITEGQLQEIDQMRAILRRLDGGDAPRVQ